MIIFNPSTFNVMPSKALIVVAVIVVIAVVGAGFVLMQQPSPQQAPAPKPAPAPAPQPAPPPPPYVPPSGLKASLVVALNPIEIAKGNLTAANKAWVLEGAIMDKQCRVFFDERVTTNGIYMVDPKSQNPKPVLVAKVPQMLNTPARGDPQMVNPGILDMAWDKQGNLYISGSGLPGQDPAKPVGFVWRVDANKLDPANPGEAKIWGTETIRANGIAIDKNGNVYVSGNNTIYRVPSTGGKAEVLKKGVNGTNNIAFNKDGTILWATNTAGGAIWKIDIARDGTVAGVSEWIKDPKLFGADGIAVDVQGNLWVTALARNAIVTITPDKKIIDVVKNDNNGPLEAPTDVHFCGKTIYIGSADFEISIALRYDKNNPEPGNSPRQLGVGPNISKVDVGIEGLPLPP